jgi:hypothetical protein
MQHLVSHRAFRRKPGIPKQNTTMLSITIPGKIGSSDIPEST